MTLTEAFYCTLGNLHLKYRQQLSNIQLWALVKSSVHKEYGMKTVFPQKTKQMYFVWSTDMQDFRVYGLYSLTNSDTNETSFYIVLKYNIL